jgi:hypothetical protein
MVETGVIAYYRKVHVPDRLSDFLGQKIFTGRQKTRPVKQRLYSD